jgi:hypothetical protein
MSVISVVGVLLAEQPFSSVLLHGLRSAFPCAHHASFKILKMNHLLTEKLPFSYVKLHCSRIGTQGDQEQRCHMPIRIAMLSLTHTKHGNAPLPFAASLPSTGVGRARREGLGVRSRAICGISRCARILPSSRPTVLQGQLNGNVAIMGKTAQATKPYGSVAAIRASERQQFCRETPPTVTAQRVHGSPLAYSRAELCTMADSMVSPGRLRKRSMPATDAWTCKRAERLPCNMHNMGNCKAEFSHAALGKCHRISGQRSS